MNLCSTSEKISCYYKEEFQGIKISYTKEIDPLGTGGGIRLAMTKCTTSDVLVLNGDSFFDVNLNDYQSQHKLFQSDCSLALRKVDNAARYGTITLDNSLKINAFKEKDSVEKEGVINGGVYILNRNVFLANTKQDAPFSIEKDFFEKNINELTMFGFEYQGYFIDIGIPEDYEKAQDDFKEFKYK